MSGARMLLIRVRLSGVAPGVAVLWMMNGVLFFWYFLLSWAMVVAARLAWLFG